MKKTALTLCLIGCGVSAAHAQSNVTLYGIVDGGFNYINNVGVVQTAGSAGTPAVYANKTQIKQNSGGYSGSRWGLKGNEDLGGGNSAIFQLENGFNVASGAFSSSGVEFNRQAYVGLSSKSYGTVTFGRQYEAISDLVSNYGPTAYGSYVSTYPGDISNYDGDIHVNNSVKYVTPQFHGVTGELLYGFGNVAGSIGQDNTINAGVQYDNGPFGIGVAYLRMDNSHATSNTWNGSADGNFSSSIAAGFTGAEKIQLANAATRYKFGKLSVGLSYGYVNYRPSAVSVFTKVLTYNSVGANTLYMFTPSYGIGAGYSYTRGTSVADGASRPAYQAVTLSSIYYLSKSVMIYGAIGYQHATGKTVDAYGNVIEATASIGDSADGASSGSNSQILARVGLRKAF